MTGGGQQKNTIFPAINMQKKNTGLSGLMTEVNGSNTLNHLDLVTDEVYAGISVVKCNITETQSTSLLEPKQQKRLQERLDVFMQELDARSCNKQSVILEQVLPDGVTNDFWWLNNSCEFNGKVAVQDCILHDHLQKDLNFYEAFTCINKSDRSMNDDEHREFDESYRDGSAWDPFLHGSIGLYTQKCGDTRAFFLVCVSDFSCIASDIIRSPGTKKIQSGRRESQKT